jgi:hypothetical protein
MPSDDFNPYAAPKADLKWTESVPTGIWRDGRLMVVTKDSRLPSRCIHCNGETDWWLRWTMTWYEPTWYLLSVSRSISMQVPLCALHRRRRRWRMTIGWLLYLGAFGVVGILGAAARGGPLAFACLAFPVMIAVGLTVLSRGLAVAKVDHARDGWVWLSGISQGFLDDLPQWQP